jgi:hypothetical protein
MGGVEAYVGIRMQDTRTRYPSFEDWADSVPTRATALAAASKHRAPQIAEPVTEAAQRRRVTRDSVVAVVTCDYTFQPLSYDVDSLMHALAQHRSDLVQCCSHPLGLGLASHDEIAVEIHSYQKLRQLLASKKPRTHLVESITVNVWAQLDSVTEMVP